MSKVLIVGATGLVGSNLVTTCKEAGHDVYALIRPDTASNGEKMRPLQAAEINIMEGSLEDYQSMLSACKEVEVVVSTVNGPGLGLQTELVKAAKECSIQRIIPSDFGIDPYVVGINSCVIFDQKLAIHQVIKEAGLNYTFIHTNGFFEYWLYSLGQIGLMAPPEEEIEVYGDGNAKMGLVSVYDVCRVTAVTLDDPRTLNQELVIMPNANSQNELIQLWEELSGKKLSRKMVTLKDIEKVITESTAPEAFMNLLLAQLKRSAFFRRDGEKSREEVLQATTLYPDIVFTTTREALAQIAQKSPHSVS